MTAPATAQPIVLVTFYSCCGTTEMLALSAAVGAVQARGLIRLRRLPDPDAARTLAQHPDCRDTLARMHKEYVAPAEADILAADALIVGAPGGSSATSPEWRDYLSRLTRLGADGRLAGKVAAVVDAGDPSTVESFASALLALGFSAPAPAPVASVRTHDTDSAIALGRLVAETARALKQTAG
jgi:hypothetical protein